MLQLVFHDFREHLISIVILLLVAIRRALTLAGPLCVLPLEGDFAQLARIGMGNARPVQFLRRCPHACPSFAKPAFRCMQVSPGQRHRVLCEGEFLAQSCCADETKGKPEAIGRVTERPIVQSPRSRRVCRVGECLLILDSSPFALPPELIFSPRECKASAVLIAAHVHRVQAVSLRVTDRCAKTAPATECRRPSRTACTTPAAGRWDPWGCRRSRFARFERAVAPRGAGSRRRPSASSTAHPSGPCESVASPARCRS